MEFISTLLSLSITFFRNQVSATRTQASTMPRNYDSSFAVKTMIINFDAVMVTSVLQQIANNKCDILIPSH